MKHFTLLSLLAMAFPAMGQSLLVTNLADSGAGSLRSQIAAANADGDLGVIEFSDGLTGTILVGTALVVTRPLEIRATVRGGIVLDGEDSGRVLEMSGSSSATPHVLENLVIQNGSTTRGGGNIRAIGSLQVLNCEIRSGRAVATFGGDNDARNGDGGGLFHSQGTLLIADSLFAENEAVGGFSQGGGFYTEGGSAMVLRSRIIDNTTNGNVGEGAGLGTRSVMTVDGCEISGNETLGTSSGGGGIYSDTTITMLNTTFSGNVVGRAPGSGVTGYSVGGAFANVGFRSATFRNCTITGNFAPPGRGQGGGVSSLSRGVLSFENCIIVGNGPGDDVDETRNRVVNYRDDGFNLFGVVANTILANPANQNATSIYGVTDAGLGDLGFFGGTTRCHIPVSGGLAEDGGSRSRAGLPSTDQRGEDFPRFVGERVDVGAVELQRFFDENDNGVPDAVEEIIAGYDASSGDFDEDGFSDEAEYVFLGVAAIGDPSVSPSSAIGGNLQAGSLSFRFPSSPNREYRLEESPDLVTPFVAVSDDYIGFRLGQGLFTEAIDGPRSFYRIEGRVPPSFEVR